MTFHINARERRMSRAKHRDMDKQIQVCITSGRIENHVDDVRVDGCTVYRRIGSVEIVNTPKTYVIYGEAESATIEALHKVLTEFGCKIK